MDFSVESVHNVDHDACCGFFHAAEESRRTLEKVCLFHARGISRLTCMKETCCRGFFRRWPHACWLNDSHRMSHDIYHRSHESRVMHADTYQLGLTWGGQEYSWSSVRVIVTLILGTLLTLAFILWQWKGTKYPLIPSTLLTPSVNSSRH